MGDLTYIIGGNPGADMKLWLKKLKRIPNYDSFI